MENMIANLWNRNKIILKSFLIGFLILLLLIPTLFIDNLVSERQERQQQAVAEVSSRWGGPQTITGPVIGIPYTETITDAGKVLIEKRWAYFLPGKLDIRTHIVPEKRYRGIYKVIVYTTELQISGNFDSLHLADLNIPEDRLLWGEAAIFFDISDVQGLKEDVVLHLSGGTDLNLVPAKFSTRQFKNALSASLPATIAPARGPVQFSAKVVLKGSGSLLFVPTGKDTRVEAISSWSNPSFSGAYLPDTPEITDSGFKANWKVLYMNRKFPQQWKETIYDLSSAAFGVDLIVPVGIYQQMTRSVKYAVLIILLTFTAFFLIEWICEKPIHSMQYLLVGIALCLFYTLLLSFSEYIGFNAAYAVASTATIGLIAWYVGMMLRSSGLSWLIALLLMVQYGFVFTLIQLQDYALLMGSVGLFITLGLVMYFSKKIKWH
jgi:inner membrane protein